MKSVASLFALLLVSIVLSCGRPSSEASASTTRETLTTVRPTVRNNCRAVKILVRVLTDVASDRHHRSTKR
jgi:hypothetical protein